MHQATLPGIVPVEPTSETKPRLVSADHVFQIDPAVAVCPYCEGPLAAQATEWMVDPDDYGTAGDIDMHCLAEEDSPIRHDHMPYVYWLPVQSKVIEWINTHYQFDMVDYPGELKP